MRCRGRLVGARVALVVAAGAAVAEEMLGGRDDVPRPHEVRGAGGSLQPFDHRARIVGNDRRCLRIAFVGAAPAVVLHDRKRRREAPVDPGRGGLGRGRRADAADEAGVVRVAEPDVVRKQRRSDDVVVAVDGVGAPDHGNGRPAVGARHRRVPERIRQRQPVARRRGFVVPGRGVAAVEYRAEFHGAQIVRRHAVDIDLDDLRDLVLDRHRGEQCRDPSLDRRIARRRLDLRPCGGMRGRCLRRGRRRLRGRRTARGPDQRGSDAGAQHPRPAQWTAIGAAPTPITRARDAATAKATTAT